MGLRQVLIRLTELPESKSAGTHKSPKSVITPGSSLDGTASQPITAV